MRRSEGGSMLVEALVATVIVAGVLGVMFQAMSQATARHRDIEARRTALMIAQSRMASVGIEIPASPGEVDGAEGDFNWRVRIDAGAGGGIAKGRVGPPALVVVSVRLARGGDDLVVLKSQRLTPAT